MGYGVRPSFHRGDSASDPGRLLTEGIYSRVRNPRYIEVLCGLLAYTCVANFSGTWVLMLLSVPGLHLVVLLEERELSDRIGIITAGMRGRRRPRP